MRTRLSHISPTAYGYCLCALFFLGCNTNEVFPILTVPQKDPNELVSIAKSELLSVFSATARQTIQFTTDEAASNVGNLHFYVSHDLSASQAGIQNVIINIHGLSASDQNVSAEYNSMVSAVGSAGAISSTLILAPHFFHEGVGLELDWENATWRAGGKASTPIGAALSSSQVVDYFLTEYLLDNANFPNLANIVIAGHSAGGQFVQRYAAISRVDHGFPGYSFTYLAANASHYLYLNNQRWDGNAVYTPMDCPAYNEYPYGLDALTADSRYAFIGKIGTESIRGQYLNRNVYYVLGEEDNSGATTDCESQSQEGGSGASRLRRGQHMLAYMNSQYPSHRHSLLTIPAVGHDAAGIYNSPAYITLLNNLLD